MDTERTIANTRAALRLDTLDALRATAEERAVEIEGGALDGVRVLSLGVLAEVLADAAAAPLPIPSEHSAEVSTPASIVVAAICPRCNLPGSIILLVEPELRVDSSGAELRIKAKAKPRLHVCGQLALDLADGQQAFDLNDITGGGLRLVVREYGGTAVEPVTMPKKGEDPCGAEAPHEGELLTCSLAVGEHEHVDLQAGFAWTYEAPSNEPEAEDVVDDAPDGPPEA